MSYQIKWEPHGAIKYFTGVVTSRDLLESERKVVNHPDFSAFRYLISVYLTADRIAFSDEVRKDVRALRLGGYQTNPRIKYATVTQDPQVVENIRQSVESGEALHDTQAFNTFFDAVIWANQQTRPTPSTAGKNLPTGAGPAPAATLPFSDAEQRRLGALQRLQVLDTAPESDYDDVVTIASLICETPIALISLVDADRQWFKAKVGLDVTETPRTHSFCAQAIHQPTELMEVRDASTDPRFAHNPLVTGAPDIRFYAGIPLLAEDGEAIGTVCVIDNKPRALNPQQATALRALGRLVTSRLALHKKLVQLQGAKPRT